jgi:tRNA(Ile)-lysidine synthase
MQQKVETYIQKHQLLTHDKPVIIGVSGGTDSVVLLHILNSLGYKCIVAHCNFHLRMEESDRDEEFVRNMAKVFKLPIYCIEFETIKYAKENGISIEMAARDLRYNWFNELVEKLDAQAIAVAHHADDNIETMLINLVRGTGLRGLRGIPVRNKKVVRPLLFCTREEIEIYLIRHDLDHVEDSTNAALDYNRNKIRNEVLPLLTEINPSVRQTLYKTIQHIEGILTIYEQAIDNIENNIVQKADGIIKLDIELINQQADIPTVMYEILYPYHFTPSVIEQITSQLDAESGKEFFSETHRLVKDRKHLIITGKNNNVYEDYYISQEIKSINKPFDLTIKKINISSDFIVSKDKNIIHIDASKITFPLQIRKWKEGDSFYPFGMNQRKKVSDFFINNKLSLIEKEQSWLLISGNEIVWIIGQRMDNRYKVSDQTKEVIEFNYKPIQI